MYIQQHNPGTNTSLMGGGGGGGELLDITGFMVFKKILLRGAMFSTK